VRGKRIERRRRAEPAEVARQGGAESDGRIGERAHELAEPRIPQHGAHDVGNAAVAHQRLDRADDDPLGKAPGSSVPSLSVPNSIKVCCRRGSRRVVATARVTGV
jgi:hypothetical protein